MSDLEVVKSSRWTLGPWACYSTSSYVANGLLAMA